MPVAGYNVVQLSIERYKYYKYQIDSIQRLVVVRILQLRSHCYSSIRPSRAYGKLCNFLYSTCTCTRVLNSVLHLYSEQEVTEYCTV
jgi:hypothetical protein